MNLLIYLMGGSGVRFGSGIPKQYADVKGKPLFSYALAKYAETECIHKIVVVSNPGYMDLTRDYAMSILQDKYGAITEGGSTRLKSIQNGIICARQYLHDHDVMLVHDANVPILELDGIDDLIESIKINRAVVVGTNQLRSIYQRDKNDYIVSHIPRETLGVAYGLEGFIFGDICRIFSGLRGEDLSRGISVSALLHEMNIPVKFFPIDALNLKITYPYELEVYKKLIN